MLLVIIYVQKMAKCAQRVGSIRGSAPPAIACDGILLGGLLNFCKRYAQLKWRKSSAKMRCCLRRVFFRARATQKTLTLSDGRAACFQVCPNTMFTSRVSYFFETMRLFGCLARNIWNVNTNSQLSKRSSQKTLTATARCDQTRISMFHSLREPNEKKKHRSLVIAVFLLLYLVNVHQPIGLLKLCQKPEACEWNLKNSLSSS